MNKKELLELIASGEGYNLEFKENLSNSIGKSICAFANASGGKILLGVSDKNKIIGFKNNNKNSSEIQTIARNMDPAFEVEFKIVDDVGIILVPEGKNKPYSINGSFYLRQSANSQKLNRDEIYDFFLKINKIPFDKKINKEFNMTKDFDNNKFQSFRKLANIDTAIQKEHLLENLSLTINGKITNACVLLFPYKVTKFFLNADVSCAIYLGTTKATILDRKDFDEDFISNFDNAVLFVERNTRTKATIKGTRRIEESEIPEEALREAIINAMIHRDYFIEGRVQIEIFSDKVVISNPGSLLFDKAKLGTISSARNPILVDCMHRTKHVEKLGSGINRIQSLVPNVEFDISSNWFMTIFPREDIHSNTQYGTLNDTENGTLNDTEKLIIKEMSKNPSITYDALENLVGKSRRTIIRQVNMLKEKEIIKRIGSDKTGHWEVLKKI
ncbi:MAG: RNA-binding domain-containing protein [Candidatus Woesearchaeota archaeon]